MNANKIKSFKKLTGVFVLGSLYGLYSINKNKQLIQNNNNRTCNSDYTSSVYLSFCKKVVEIKDKCRFSQNSVLECWGKVKKNHDLYLWGNGSADHTSDYSNYMPHKIIHFYDLYGNDISDKFKRIKQIEFGNYFTAYLNEEGELYVSVTPFLSSDSEESLVEIEVRSDLQNSFDNKKENKDDKIPFTMNELLFPPSNVRKGLIKISGDKRIEQAKFTKNQIFFTDSSGNLFMYRLIIGNIVNSDHYIKGPQIPEVLNISSDLIQIKEVKGVKQIDSGLDHLMILCKDGSVFGMGDDSFGQLGLGTFSEERIHQMKTYGNFIMRRESIPKKVDIENINKIACGDNHTLLLDKKGNVYGMGFNRFLQLSNDELYREKYIGLNTPTLISKLTSTAFIKDNPVGNSVKKVIDIVCSGNCSFFVTEEKINDNVVNYEVYAAGEGLKGALGINHIRHMSDIEMLQDVSGLINTNTLNPIKIQSFACGNKHCLLLFKNPRIIFSWGNNEYGELGTKDRAFTESPLPMLEEITIPNKIIKVFAGKHNSGFIAEARDESKVKEIIEQDNKLYQEQIEKLKERKKQKKLNKQKKEEDNEKQTKEETTKEEEEDNKSKDKEESYLNKAIKVFKKYF